MKKANTDVADLPREEVRKIEDGALLEVLENIVPDMYRDHIVEADSALLESAQLPREVNLRVFEGDERAHESHRVQVWKGGALVEEVSFSLLETMSLRAFLQGLKIGLEM